MEKNTSDETRDKLRQAAIKQRESYSPDEKATHAKHTSENMLENKHTLGRVQPLEEVRRRVDKNRGQERSTTQWNNIRSGLLASKGTRYVVDGVNQQTVLNRCNSASERFSNWNLEKSNG